MSQELILTGVITEVGEVKQGQKSASVRFVVTEDEGRYPMSCEFSIFGRAFENESQKIFVGNKVSVHFELSRHEYNGRYYNDISAYQIDGEEWQEPQDGGAGY